MSDLLRTPADAAASGKGSLTPVTPGERLLVLDVLRGFALLGILVVNVLDYAPEASTASSRTLKQGIDVIAAGSFYPLFSILFGIGFAIFLDRAAVRQSPATVTYLRRIAGLLVIAIAQIVLLEDRNILLRYAFLALPLLCFSRASARVCLFAAVVVFALACARGSVHRMIVAHEMADPARASEIRAERQAEQQLSAERARASRAAGETGSFLSFAAFRAKWQVANQMSWSINLRRNRTLLHIFSMFLLGAAVWRARVLIRPTSRRTLLWSMSIMGLLLGVGGNMAKIRGPAPPAPAGTLAAVVDFGSDTALALAYGALIILIATSGRLANAAHAIAPVGRMGLSNYLLQSLVLSLVFLPYGLALESRLPFWSYPAIALLVYVINVVVSGWWLARHQTGPAEWAWRAMTYGSVVGRDGALRGISRR